MKKKLLIFHPALAPYRVDQFNDLSKIFDLHIVFLFEKVWYDNFDQKELLKNSSYQYSYLLKGPDYKGRTLRFGMLKKIRRQNPDYVMGYEYSFTTIFLVMLKNLGLIKMPIGITTDDSIEMCTNISAFRLQSKKYCLPKLDFLVVLSNKVKNYFIENNEVSENKIIVSPILQNSDKLRSNSSRQIEIAENYKNKFKLSGKINLLFVGRLVNEKGLIEFLEHFAELNQKKLYNFIMVGDGDLKDTLFQKIVKLHLTDSVFLPGRFKGDDLYAWYTVASGFVLPSKFEPFGAVINEAQIFGLKAFCSDLAGASVLIDNKSKGDIFSIHTDYKNALKNFLDSLEILSEIKYKDSLVTEQDILAEWKKLLDRSI